MPGAAAGFGTRIARSELFECLFECRQFARQALLQTVLRRAASSRLFAHACEQLKCGPTKWRLGDLIFSGVA